MAGWGAFDSHFLRNAGGFWIRSKEGRVVGRFDKHGRQTFYYRCMALCFELRRGRLRKDAAVKERQRLRTATKLRQQLKLHPAAFAGDIELPAPEVA